MIPKEALEILRKHHYKVVGKHSAVKLCHWTKKSILTKGERFCYKQKFYGIKSHRCLQMSPSVAWCQHRCLFCWRPVEHTLGEEINVSLDEPSFIVEKSIEAQRSLLSGYWGEKRVDRKDMEEAWNPKHAAISLAGEPTTYPYIDELIEEYHKHGFTTFLVTNGMHPERLEKVKPYQLYLSLIGYDEESYKRICRPTIKDGWQRLMKSLEIFSGKKQRKVIRLTLVKGYNLEHAEKFAKLIELASPTFIEAKGYVHVGFSRQRLRRENMPTFDEVKEFAIALEKATGYKIKDYVEESKVVQLAK